MSRPRRPIRINTFHVIAALLIWPLISATPATCQEERKIIYKARGEDTKYTIQHIIDVGDMPGHQIRIAEVRRTFPADNPLAFDGVRVVEQYHRFFSDFVNWSGRHWGYFVGIMENGDRIYGRGDGTNQSAQTSDGSIRTTYSGLFTYTSGTGRFKGLRGTGKYNGIFDPVTGFNEATWEIEYWME